MYEDCDEIVPVRNASEIETPSDSDSLSPPWTRKSTSSRSTGTAGYSGGSKPVRKQTGRMMAKPSYASANTRDLLSPLPDRLTKPTVHYAEDGDSSSDFDYDYGRYNIEDVMSRIDDVTWQTDHGRSLKKGVARVDIRESQTGEQSNWRGDTTLYDPMIDNVFLQDCFTEEDADVPSEVRGLFGFVTSFRPRELDIEYKMKIFVPKLQMAVGDVDALLKVAIPPAPWHMMPPRPNQPSTSIPQSLTELGITTLDEPSGEQSSPAFLHMRLRDELSTPATPGTRVPTAIAKTPKDIDKWICEMTRLRTARITERGQTPTCVPLESVHQHLHPFPVRVRHALDSMGSSGTKGNAFPAASALDCPLSTYAKIVCALLDIPVEPPGGLKETLKALHVLFSVYSSLKSEHDFYQ